MVRVAETGDGWDALGWSPDGPLELAIETSHDAAVTRAILHAREVANGTEQQRADTRRRLKEREQARWQALEDHAAPPIADPE